MDGEFAISLVDFVSRKIIISTDVFATKPLWIAIENDEFVITGVVTANKLKNAFLKMNKKRQVSRVMVSRFIEGIAV